MGYQLIVGLGNPGGEYAPTRHNIGFRVVDAFAARWQAQPWRKDRSLKAELGIVEIDSFGSARLLKPLTFMNQSGSAVQKACSYFRIPPDRVVVVYDEANLAVGEIKLSLAGSAGGHNGLASILEFLPPRFARLRIGIGQKRIKEMPLADYVLGKFSPEEETLINASMDRFLDSLERLLREGSEKAMNHINRKRTTDDTNSISL